MNILASNDLYQKFNTDFILYKIHIEKKNSFYLPKFTQKQTILSFPFVKKCHKIIDLVIKPLDFKNKKNLSCHLSYLKTIIRLHLLQRYFEDSVCFDVCNMPNFLARSKSSYVRTKNLSFENYVHSHIIKRKKTKKKENNIVQKTLKKRIYKKILYKKNYYFSQIVKNINESFLTLTLKKSCSDKIKQSFLQVSCSPSSFLSEHFCLPNSEKKKNTQFSKESSLKNSCLYKPTFEKTHQSVSFENCVFSFLNESCEKKNCTKKNSKVYKKHPIKRTYNLSRYRICIMQNCIYKPNQKNIYNFLYKIYNIAQKSCEIDFYAKTREFKNSEFAIYIKNQNFKKVDNVFNLFSYKDLHKIMSFASPILKTSSKSFFSRNSREYFNRKSSTNFVRNFITTNKNENKTKKENFLKIQKMNKETKKLVFEIKSLTSKKKTAEKHFLLYMKILTKKNLFFVFLTFWTTYIRVLWTNLMYKNLHKKIMTYSVKLGSVSLFTSETVQIKTHSFSHTQHHNSSGNENTREENRKDKICIFKQNTEQTHKLSDIYKSLDGKKVSSETCVFLDILLKTKSLARQTLQTTNSLYSILLKQILIRDLFFLSSEHSLVSLKDRIFYFLPESGEALKKNEDLLKLYHKKKLKKLIKKTKNEGVYELILKVNKEIYILYKHTQTKAFYSNWTKTPITLFNKTKNVQIAEKSNFSLTKNTFFALFDPNLASSSLFTPHGFNIKSTFSDLRKKENKVYKKVSVDPTSIAIKSYAFIKYKINYYKEKQNLQEKETNEYLNEMLWKWAKRRHNSRSNRWIYHRYWNKNLFYHENNSNKYYLLDYTFQRKKYAYFSNVRRSLFEKVM